MKNKEIIGGTIEHWMDKRLRLGLPINLEGNVPRMSAETMLKLHNLKNKLRGTNYTLHEAAQMEKEGSAE